MKNLYKMVVFMSIALNTVLGVAPAQANDPYKELGIVIIPTSEVTAEAARLNAEIVRQLPGMDNKKNLFHITLYHGRYPHNQLPALYKILDDLTYRQFLIEMEPKLHHVNNQYIVWNVKESSALQGLHELIVQLASPHRYGNLQRAIDSYNKLDTKSQSQVDNYGVSGILDRYSPHITLYYGQAQYAKMPEIAEKTKLNVSTARINFNAQTIAIGELGYQGNLLSILHQVHLMP